MMNKTPIVELWEGIGNPRDPRYSFFGGEMQKRIDKANDVDDSKKDLTRLSSADDDLAIVTGPGGYLGLYDLNGASDSDSEKELILKYREAATQPEADMAINDIVDEAVASLESGPPVKLVVDDLEYEDSVKNKILSEFDAVLKLFNFSENGSEMFKSWYIDGRLYYHIVVDRKNLKDGIQELNLLDATQISRVKEVKEEIDRVTNAKISEVVSEYYVYSEESTGGTQATINLPKASVLEVNSGIVDSRRKRRLSYLHKALKPINQLRLMEDSLVIYRIARAPERRVFYIDTGNLPKGKAEEYVRNVMSQYRNKVSYDVKTGEMQSDRKHLNMLEDFFLPRREGSRGTEISTLQSGCLAMDTKVSLLDGRELSIAEIEAEMAEGKTLWTYSCHPTRGDIIPGKISWAGVTQKSAQVMKLTLDNGEEIICTLDHKFPVYEKGFVEAKDLAVGESMIPLYRKKQIMCGKTDYEMTFDNATKTWEYTHRMVTKHVQCEHLIHQLPWTDEMREAARERRRIRNTAMWQSEEFRKHMREKQKLEFSHDMLQFIINLVKGKTTHEVTRWDVVDALNNNAEMVSQLTTLNEHKNVPNWTPDDGYSTTIVDKIVATYGYKNWKDFRVKESLHNHRIVAIEYLPDPIEVGTLTIDNEYHTFALTSGIFTKNSSLGDLDDVVYFVQQLYKALHVPRSRMDNNDNFPGVTGRALEITRDEIKFQKFINRLRKRFSYILLDALKIQLQLKGIVTESDWDDIVQDLHIDFVKDNHFYELKEFEVFQSRLSIMRDLKDYVGDYFSKDFVYKNIFQMNDTEIEEMQAKIAEEKKEGLHSDEGGGGGRW